jgi:MFS family permease
MSITFGIVGLERMVIAFVMPGIQQEFNLSYTQVGAIVSIFGFTWAFGSWLMGSLSDYVGRRVVLITLMTFGGVCSWLTGIAGSFIMLLLVRGVMGFAEGGVASPVFAVVAEESAPQSRAKSMSLTTGLMVLFGGAIGPILSTALMATFGWRGVFYMYAGPAIIMAILILLFVREPASTLAAAKARKEGRKRLDAYGREVRYADAFKNRNVIMLAVMWVAQMIWLWLFTTFGVMFLVKVHHLPITTMGLVMTFFGVAVFVGGLFFGFLADHIGRRTVLTITLVLGGLFGFLFASLHPGASLFMIIASVFLYSCTSGGAGGTLTTMGAESVGPLLAATATGFINGFGELVGGGIFPTIGGGIADALGLSTTLYVAAAISIAAGIMSCFLRETLERRKAAAVAAAPVA